MTTVHLTDPSRNTGATSLTRLQKYLPPHGHLSVHGYVHVEGERNSCGALHADPREPCDHGGVVRPGHILFTPKWSAEEAVRGLCWQSNKRVLMDQLQDVPVQKSCRVFQFEETDEEAAYEKQQIDAFLVEYAKTGKTSPMTPEEERRRKEIEEAQQKRLAGRWTTVEELEKAALARVEAMPEFEGRQVRVTPDGRFVAIDVLFAIGQADPIRAWRNIKATYPDLKVEGSATFPFGKGGRSPEVVTEKGLHKLLMVARGPRAAQFREWASELIARFRRGETLQVSCPVEPVPVPAPTQAPQLPEAPRKRSRLASAVDSAGVKVARRAGALAPRAKTKELGQIADILVKIKPS